MAKGIYVGVDATVPMTIKISADNIYNYFTVTNGSYAFVGNGNTFTSNNKGVKSTTASTTLVALQDIANITFDYSYSSESGYDKFTLKVAGNTIENAVSGATTNKSYSGALTKGQSVEFTYTKDKSSDVNDDQCTFSNMVIVCPLQIPAGSTVNGIARKVKKAYAGIGTTSYEKLEYIESNGTQYINTGVNPKNTTRIILRCAWIKGTANFIGSKDGKGFIIYYPSNQGVFYTMFVSAYASTGIAGVSGKITEIDMNGVTNTITIDGTDVTLTTGTFSTSVPMYMFAYNSNGTAAASGTLRIYSCKIYDNGTLIRDYIPCKNASNIVGMYDKVNRKFYENLGTGTFIAGNSTQEIFDDGTARKIKKAYVGVNGVARCIFSQAGKFSFYKKGTALSAGRNRLSAGSNSKYVLVAGGYTGSHSKVVDAYNTTFTRSTAPELKNNREQISSATAGERIFFAGGEGGGGGGDSGDTAYIDTYNISLTKTMAPNLSDEAQFIHSGAIGDYALFGTNATVADAYNESLTKTTTTGLSNYRDTGASAVAGNGAYLVFAAGTTDKDSTSKVTNIVDAYDASLTRFVPAPLSLARSRHGGASVGGRALFGGGYDPNSSNSSTASVEAYDGSLTRTTLASPLSVARRGLRGCSAPGFAIFAMGYDGSDLNTVDVYDESLTRTTAQGTATAGDDPATASFGNYAIVTGGAGDSRISDFNIYQVTYE